MRHVRRIAILALAALLLVAVGGCGSSRSSGAKVSAAGVGSGAARATRANTHQADANNDGQITIDEMTAYIQAWKLGTYDDINLVTNAIGIWKGGETYHYDSSVTPPYVAGSGGGTSNPYKWTIMVFLDANQDPAYPDSNLEPYAVENVNQMEMLPDSNNVAIIVLMSRLGSSGGGSWTGARRFRVRHDGDTTLMSSARTPEEGGSAENLGTVDMGDWNNVKSFITWCQANYPADHYAVDLWDHGSGTLRSRHAAKRSPLERSILFDDLSGNAVTTPQLSQALVGTSKIDMVLFDACAMQMMEIAYQIRNNCDVIVGSEDLTPGDGYPYHLTFDLPISNPSVTTEEFATHVVTAFTNYYTGYQVDSTQSALRTSQLGSLYTAVSAYGSTLNGKVGTHGNAISSARAATQQFGGTSYSNYEGYRDLVDFVTRVATATNDVSLVAGRASVKAAVEAAVIASGKYGSSNSGANGISIWLPSSNTYRTWAFTYSLNSFASSSNWTNWMRTLYGN